jgi:hypothetical protein
MNAALPGMHLHEAELLAGQGAANDVHFQTLARTLMT